MRTLAARRRALCCLLLAYVVTTQEVLAGGVGVSEPPDEVRDTTLSTSGSTTFTSVPFHLYKPRADRSPRGRRDLEVLWSETYKSLFRMPLDSLSGVEQINDLQRLAETICEQNANPFGLPFTDIELAYNVLSRHENYRDSLYDSNPEHSVGFRVAQPEYLDPDRNHLDLYVYAPSFANHGQWGSYWGDGGSPTVTIENRGTFPSDYMWSAEDSLTGGTGSPKAENSIMIPGPLPSRVGETGATRWTRAGGTANGEIVHEGLHAVNADPGFAGADEYLHMFASGAEVVTGASTDAPRFDVDYHYSLSPTGGNPGNAYPHWLSFMAYLAFNWRGDNLTPVGWQDDLLPRWAKAPASERDLHGLAKRLRDSECTECATYPGFAGLDSLARVQRLIHDWRVANYVNNASLAGGKYGFPAEFGFSPANQLGAWQDVDPSPGATNAVAIPPVVTVGPSPAARSQWFSAHPGGPGFGPRPMDMQMFGAEYFIFQADPALAANPQELVVRVRPGMVRRRTILMQGTCDQIPVPDDIGRIHASIVTYSQAGDSLFRHPDWATGVVTQSAILDSVRGDLEFEIPEFGGAAKAVLVVVSLGDGPTGTLSRTNKFGITPMRLELGALLDDGATPIIGQPVASSSLNETDAAWSPDGQLLAYKREEPSGGPRIYLRNANGTGAASPLRSASAAQAEPAWSPRGDRIAYVEGSGLTQIWFVALPSGQVQLGVSQSGALHEPAWSPDGGRLAYLQEWTVIAPDPDPPPEEGDLNGTELPGFHAVVRVRNIASGADTVLAHFHHAQPGLARQLLGLRWTSDSNFLTFSRFDPDSGRYRLHQLDMHSRALTSHDHQAPAARTRELAPGTGPLLTEETPNVPFEVECSPYASVFCGCIAFGAIPSEWLAVRDTTSGSSVRLGHRSGATFTNSRWSPDGTRVAYTTTQNGNPDVYVIAATLDRAPLMSSLVLPFYSQPTCNPFELSLVASDPDADPITFRAFGLPPGASLQNGYRIYWPTPVVGDHWFVAQALDPTGAVASRLIHLNVYDGGQCGGGGGGEGEGEIIPGGGHSARTAGRSRVVRPGQTSPRAVNSFLDGAVPGDWVEQTARLVAARVDESGLITANLLGLRQGEFKLDRARLLVVDHAPTLVPVVTDGGIALGTRRHPSTIAVSAGTGTPDGLVPAGTTLSVSWTEADSVDGLLIDCARGGSVDSLSDWGVVVEQNEGEEWRFVELLKPRSGRDILAAALDGRSGIRLRFLSDVYVYEVTGYAVVEAHASGVTGLSCSSASLGEALEALAKADGVPLTLGRGQGVALSFAAGTAAEGTKRTLFLEMIASFTPAVPTSAQSEVAGIQPSAPFALHPSLPNPFERSTSIRLELPRACKVRLEIFDAQGRRVRDLVDQSFPPGIHSVEWNGADSRGRSLGPGIYLVRMIADDFRSERRVVRLGR